MRLLRHASVLAVALGVVALVARQPSPVAASPLSPRAIGAIQIDAVVQQPAAAPMPVTRPAKTVVVRRGDTVESLVAAYGGDVAAARWANGLAAGAEPAPGAMFLLPPGRGALVAVLPGETPTAFAARLHIDAALVLDYNVLTSNAPLSAGSYLQVPLQDAPAGALVSSVFSASEQRLVPRVPQDHGNDGFPFGQCTWYVASRRNVTWGGNAWMWWFAAAGIRPEGHVPVEGAIVVFDGGWAGHVAYVEHVNTDGTFVVSEMNYYGDGGGWGRVDERTIHDNDPLILGFIY